MHLLIPKIAGAFTLNFLIFPLSNCRIFHANSSTENFMHFSCLILCFIRIICHFGIFLQYLEIKSNRNLHAVLRTEGLHDYWQRWHFFCTEGAKEASQRWRNARTPPPICPPQVSKRLPPFNIISIFQRPPPQAQAFGSQQSFDDLWNVGHRAFLLGVGRETHPPRWPLSSMGFIWGGDEGGARESSQPPFHPAGHRKGDNRLSGNQWSPCQWRVPPDHRNLGLRGPTAFSGFPPRPVDPFVFCCVPPDVPERVWGPTISVVGRGWEQLIRFVLLICQLDWFDLPAPCAPHAKIIRSEKCCWIVHRRNPLNLQRQEKHMVEEKPPTEHHTILMIMPPIEATTLYILHSQYHKMGVGTRPLLSGAPTSPLGGPIDWFLKKWLTGFWPDPPHGMGVDTVLQSGFKRLRCCAFSCRFFNFGFSSIPILFEKMFISEWP